MWLSPDGCRRSGLWSCIAGLQRRLGSSIAWGDGVYVQAIAQTFSAARVVILSEVQ